MRFFVLTLIVAMSSNGSESCRKDSLGKLESRTKGYYTALENGRVGSEYWGRAFRRDAGDPEEVLRQYRMMLKRIRILTGPHTTVNISTGVGNSLVEAEIEVIDGTKRKASLRTQWRWEADQLGFYDWYLIDVQSPEIIDKRDSEPDRTTKEIAQTGFVPAGLLFYWQKVLQQIATNDRCSKAIPLFGLTLSLPAFGL